MSEATIILKQVRKRYGNSSDGPYAVRDASVEIQSGEVTVLMGPSGSGKTTLLSMIGGILAPTSGEIRVAGAQLHNCDEGQRQTFRRRQVGFIFQNYNLLSSLTAIENIQVALSLRGTEISGAEALLDHVGLAGKAHAYPEELSGGQRQRVSIARALAGSPPVLLADEPTAALDAFHGRRVMALLCERARKSGTTVVIVTHDPRVREYAGRVIQMEDGKVKRILRRVRPEQARSANWTVTRSGNIVAEVGTR
jgi:putative ABC transport system ATP-binding protein